VDPTVEVTDEETSFRTHSDAADFSERNSCRFGQLPQRGPLGREDFDQMSRWLRNIDIAVGYPPGIIDCDLPFARHAKAQSSYDVAAQRWEIRW
jgi:hypothetical protein